MTLKDKEEFDEAILTLPDVNFIWPNALDESGKEVKIEVDMFTDGNIAVHMTLIVLIVQVRTNVPNLRKDITKLPIMTYLVPLSDEPTMINNLVRIPASSILIDQVNVVSSMESRERRKRLEELEKDLELKNADLQSTIEKMKRFSRFEKYMTLVGLRPRK